MTTFAYFLRGKLQSFCSLAVVLVVCFVYIGGVLSVPIDVVETAQNRIDRINNAVHGH